MDSGSHTYREMLTFLANNIRDDELKTMKYNVSGEPGEERAIPRRRLDDIDCTVDLWEALEEQELLSNTQEGLQYLLRLLVTTCPSRHDLVRIVDNYAITAGFELSAPHVAALDNVTVLKKDPGNDLTNEINAIVHLIGKRWKSFARTLGLSEAELDRIEKRHPFDLEEQIRFMFLIWKQKTDVAFVTRQTLINALNKSELRGLAETLEDMPTALK